jgi:site-specific DNA recombinase
MHEAADLTANSDQVRSPAYAAIYARTSAPNQKDNYSIAEQVAECSIFCDKRGWTARYVFVDECITAVAPVRPKFSLMMDTARAREFSAIVFWKLDRFARSLSDTVNLQKTLRGYGVELASVTEYLDTTTPVGRFNFRSLASVAELEREITGERTRLGLYALAREHRWPNRFPPFGYERDAEGRLRVALADAEVVRFIHKQYMTCKSAPQVAFVLNMNGVRPVRGAAEWRPGVIRTILQNRIYTGEYNVAGHVEHLSELAIVDTYQFDEVQRILGRYARAHAPRPPMPITRKAMMIDKMKAKYDEYLAIINNGRSATQ